jgi:hypothetical protein
LLEGAKNAAPEKSGSKYKDELKGGPPACGGAGAAADFEELFGDLGGGEVGEVVDVGILRGGEGEFAFGVASISKWFHVLNTSNQASTFGSRYTNAVGVYTVRMQRRR